MSTPVKPTEAHDKLAEEIAGICDRYFKSRAVKETAQLLADSEARAVEAATGHLHGRIGLFAKAHFGISDNEPTDETFSAMSHAIQMERTGLAIEEEKLRAALTAERERVRVLREAAEIMLVPHIENSEGGTPSGTYAMTFRYEQLAAALAFTAEHKEGSK